VSLYEAYLTTVYTRTVYNVQRRCCDCRHDGHINTYICDMWHESLHNTTAIEIFAHCIYVICQGQLLYYFLPKTAHNTIPIVRLWCMALSSYVLNVDMAMSLSYYCCFCLFVGFVKTCLLLCRIYWAGWFCRTPGHFCCVIVAVCERHK
jgi:hypothetical protein